jgi:hypothetical protein
MNDWWKNATPLLQDDLKRYGQMFDPSNDEEEEEEEEVAPPPKRPSKQPRSSFTHLIPEMAEQIKEHCRKTQVITEREREIERNEFLYRLAEYELRQEMMSFYHKQQQKQPGSFDMSQPMKPMDQTGIDQFEKVVSIEELFLSSQRGEIELIAGITDRRIFCIRNLQTRHEIFHVFTL